MASPVGVLAAHDIRVLLRSPASLVALGLLLVVTVAGAANGVRWAERQRRTLAEVEAANDRTSQAIYADLARLEAAGNPRPALPLAGTAWYIMQPEGAVAPAPHMDPRRAEAAASEWVGARYAVLPPAPLAALAVGQADIQPSYSRVTIRTRPILVQSDEIQNPLSLLHGRFDLALVLVFCWPLLVLPLTYHVLADDRDRGTLALIAAQPVTILAVLATRLAVRLGLAVLVTALSSVTTLGVMGGLDGAGVGDLACWLGAIVASALLWAGVAAVVNLTRWRSPTNAMVLVACWVGATVAAPALAGELAAGIGRVPSRVELINALRDAGNLRPAEAAALVTAYYRANPEASSTGDASDETAIKGLAQQDEVDRRIAPILSAYDRAVDRQLLAATVLQTASPPLLLYEALTELAGTSARRYRRYQTELDRFHAEWRAYFYPLVHRRTVLTRSHYEEAPRFAFRDAVPAGAARAGRLLGAVGAVGVSLCTLVAWRGRRRPFHP